MIDTEEQYMFLDKIASEFLFSFYNWLPARFIPYFWSIERKELMRKL